LFRFGVPIAAIEFEKHRGIRNSHVRLDHQDAEDLGGLVELCDDQSVREIGHAGVSQKGVKLLPVHCDAWRVLLRNKAEFLVGVDVCPYSPGGGNRIQTVRTT